MSERPIIFSASMVRAILDGRKTQTRRVIKSQPPDDELDDWRYGDGTNGEHSGEGWYCASGEYPDEGSIHWRCPYGKPGDNMWVRETFAKRIFDEDLPELVYRADNAARCFAEPDQPTPVSEIFYLSSNWRAPKWTPSIYMPRWASRITLEVTGVRVERVDAISVADVIAEGCAKVDKWDLSCLTPDPRQEFMALWDQINAKRGYPWASNPWVWVVEFKRVEVKR